MDIVPNHLSLENWCRPSKGVGEGGDFYGSYMVDSSRCCEGTFIDRDFRHIDQVQGERIPLEKQGPDLTFSAESVYQGGLISPPFAGEGGMGKKKNFRKVRRPGRKKRVNDAQEFDRQKTRTGRNLQSLKGGGNHVKPGGRRYYLLSMNHGLATRDKNR